MLSEDEREAIERLKAQLNFWKKQNIKNSDCEIILNLITKLQKENVEKDKEIKKLKENINYQTLCDFLISSTSDEEEPVWTEKHIEELLENFEVRWKNAYK